MSPGSDRPIDKFSQPVLNTENSRLTDQANKLHTDAEVERLAREQYDLVRPGEEAYAILPTAEPGALAEAPGPAPATGPNAGIGPGAVARELLDNRRDVRRAG